MRLGTRICAAPDCRLRAGRHQRRPKASSHQHPLCANRPFSAYARGARHNHTGRPVSLLLAYSWPIMPLPDGQSTYVRYPVG